MIVPFIELKSVFELHKEEYEEAVLRALRSGWYILGKELDAFESEFADYLGIEHCIGVGCGQDALTLAVRALGIGPGDEVIVAANTYIATVLAVTENGATPFFVDCNEWFQLDEMMVEEAITSRTKAVLTTNLYGQCSNLPALREVCNAHDIFLVEDCAQSHGASFASRLGGTVGDVSCFSFYPTKPLGAFGDGGACVTNDGEIAERLRMLRNYGSRKKYVNEMTGVNSRLDEIQAAVLRTGLRHLGESNAERQRIAERYLSEIHNPLVELPRTREEADNVYHIFPVMSSFRDDLAAHLTHCEVQTQIHYPTPPHLAQCYRGKGFTNCSMPNAERYAVQELSLPIYAGMPETHVDAVIAAVNGFAEGR